MTLGVCPSMSATHELVVPRSIPMMVSPFLVEKEEARQFLKMVLIICLLIKKIY